MIQSFVHHFNSLLLCSGALFSLDYWFLWPELSILTVFSACWQLTHVVRGINWVGQIEMAYQQVHSSWDLKVCLVVVCAVTMAGVFSVLVSKQVWCVLCAYPLGIIGVQTFLHQLIVRWDCRDWQSPPSQRIAFLSDQ